MKKQKRFKKVVEWKHSEVGLDIGILVFSVICSSTLCVTTILGWLIKEFDKFSMLSIMSIMIFFGLFALLYSLGSEREVYYEEIKNEK